MSPTRKLRLVGCGIFRREFGMLKASLTSRFEAHFLDSMLHMKPANLDLALEAALSAGDGPCVILYGDCCPHMRELSAASMRCRTEGCNCIEIALGSERYRALRRAANFFFMPEWLERWEEIFAFELGLGDPELARAFMQEEMRGIVYVDTGAGPVPFDELKRIGGRFGLPVTIEKAGIGGLESRLEAALAELDAKEGSGEGKGYGR